MILRLFPTLLCEVYMLGGRALILVILGSFALMAAVVLAKENSGFSDASLPKTKVAPVEETLHGHKIVDNYRWLEDANSPETKAWVEQELTYTRSVLDTLPGRASIEKRLSQ